MKRNLLEIGALCAVLAFLLVSCGKKSEEPRSQKDTSGTVTADISIKNDTSSNASVEKFTSKDVKPEIKKQNDTSAIKKENIKVIAYYFHPTARCPSCINIENFTEEVIKTIFVKENKSGLISFRSLNIEDSLNEHYIDDYKLENSSVILAGFVNNKQVKWKNLEHVWKYAMDKESFLKYMKIEIKDFLKDKDGV